MKGKKKKIESPGTSSPPQQAVEQKDSHVIGLVLRLLNRVECLTAFNVQI